MPMEPHISPTSWPHAAGSPAEPVAGLEHRVLLLDDQKLIGEAVRKMLADQSDIIYTSSTHPQEAIELAAAFRPTLILQDLVMPGLDWLEMVRRFRALPATCNVPIIILSAREEAVVKAHLFQAGANDYLVKLPDPIELIARIRVHSEAYLRLVAEPSRQSESAEPRWETRGHFFAAAAEAMRRILIEKARRKHRTRHAGHLQKVPLEGNEPAVPAPLEALDLLALSDALDRLEAASPRRARLVKLRYFAGLTLPEAAQMLGVSQSTVEADWTYAKAWLKREMDQT